jgi:hypothetical protein
MTRTALATVLVLACAPVYAQDKKPDTQAMMEAWAKHGTPGEGHKKLEPLVGVWTSTGKCWMDPSAPPSDVTGENVRTWILGGRFLQDKITGQIPGMPAFEGIGILGYDNATKRYHGYWIDNMSTSQMTSTGSFDASGKVLTTYGECFDPATGQKSKCRDVTTIISQDEHKAEMYKTENGKEIKCMELHFKRKK